MAALQGDDFYYGYDAYDWSDGGSSPFDSDETLIGPDGAVYDVFYPSGHDEKVWERWMAESSQEETSTTCSDCTGGPFVHPSNAAHQGSPVPMSRQRSAEASIEGHGKGLPRHRLGFVDGH